MRIFGWVIGRKDELDALVTDTPEYPYIHFTKDEFIELLQEAMDELRSDILDVKNLANRANVALSRHKTDHLDAVSATKVPDAEQSASASRVPISRKAGMSMRRHRRLGNGHQTTATGAEIIPDNPVPDEAPGAVEQESVKPVDGDVADDGSRLPW